MVAVRRVQVSGFHVDAGSDGVVYLSGELDMAAAEDFPSAVMAHVDSPSELILDLSDLRFIDSAGVRALLTLARVARPTPVVARAPRRNVAEVFEIVKLEALGIRVERRPTQR